MAENTINSTQYLQFDATTIDQYIKDRLNITGSQFTDHNFAGSYFSSVIEVLSYTFNVLMFYLNQTSSESMFTDAQLYENMNRIVKMLGYSPVGCQTAIVPFTVSSTAIGEGLYVIPRYSYINTGGTSYSFNEDFAFRAGSLTDATDGKVLYQGKFYEYPLYSAHGDKNEIIFLSPGNTIIIDHFNIHVYVKDSTGVWEEWTRVDSLVSKTSVDSAYEVRYNENKNYELKFGNGINGRALNTGDSVAIYYLQSGGVGNDIIPGDLADKRYIAFASSQFTEILKDVWGQNTKEVVSPSDVSINNSIASTAFSIGEDVESIRTNTPDSVKRKLTISKTIDYDRVVTTNFSNVISDVKTMNNFDYMKKYLNYFKTIGLAGANESARTLYNQVTFADACNFNNMYIFVKPKVYSGIKEDYAKFLPAPLKEMILSAVGNLKAPTVEPVVMDPVYMAVGFGINDPAESVAIADATTNCELVVIKDKKSLRNNDSIKQNVYDVIVNYFSQDNTKFGMFIDFPYLTEQILTVGGVVDFKIKRTDTSKYFYGGISLIVWNPVYTQDVQLLLRSESLQDFQVPYLYDRTNFINKIVVETEV